MKLTEALTLLKKTGYICEGKTMKPEEFMKLCREYLPNCTFKDNGTCGICCYDGGTEVTDIVVSLYDDGRYGVYDQWRDVTITKDLEYVIKWLRHCARQ